MSIETVNKGVGLAAADDADRVKALKALADPTRLQIVRYLNRVNRGVTCGEIAQAVRMSPSAGSYHFRALREAGLTLDERRSREKYVSLDKTTFRRYVPGFLSSL
ncbi:ArsR/SmtB family transcription factor [Bifidobacterium xylocopae]|uniref:Transcriptional regulator n=1 Tax=Bifidobacterium xylocopae TaxID=2493119 RepID=A0A366KBH1_9BIFI|nr:metalloregulator ArsR/SmtB family transcription factor [Bifidobacterium xylocopae]RBP99034.1 transcriptional regulator [Bifidobacterium xylocopae]